MGFAMGLSGVWIRIQIFVPSQNPYPSHGYGGLGVGFSIEMMMACPFSRVEPALCPVNTGTLVSGVWSMMGYVKGSDVLNAAILPELDGEEEDLAND